jgi:acetyl esterase/lipase
MGAVSEAKLIRLQMDKQYESEKEEHDPNVEIINTTANNVKIRIYLPIKIKFKIAEKKHPCMFWYHAGSYCFLNIDMYDSFLCRIANELELIVISVDYRLAPEHPYPVPIDDCIHATEFIIAHPNFKDLNLDTTRIITAGDSAGANAALVVTHQLTKAKYPGKKIPKLQCLIYPPTQYFNFSTPSSIYYTSIESTRPKYSLWHLGLVNATEHEEELLVKNMHTLLIKDKELKQRYQSYLDIELIPEIFRKDKEYYYSFNNLTRWIYPEETRADKALEKNEELKSSLKKLFDTKISPGLEDDEVLKKSPKTFMVVCEFDSRKDESLMYLERLRRLNIDVDVAYYEKGFHGMLLGHTEDSQSMRNDLISYIKDNI